MTSPLALTLIGVLAGTGKLAWQPHRECYVHVSCAHAYILICLGLGTFARATTVGLRQPRLRL